MLYKKDADVECVCVCVYIYIYIYIYIHGAFNKIPDFFCTGI